MFQPTLNENVYRSLLSRINGIERGLGGDATVDNLRRLIGLLQQVYGNASNLRTSLSEDAWRTIDGHCTRLRQIIDVRLGWIAQVNHDDVTLQPLQAIPDQASLSRNGRPRKDIDKHKLHALLEMGFTVSQISTKELLRFKVHRNTLTKFIKYNGLTSPRDRYTTMSDADLAVIIKELSDKRVNSGYREISAFLLSSNPPIKVQLDRVNRLLRQVDPAGTARRWSLGIQRRSYYVPTANYLWHLDTNHKLIRWNFVVNGCTDGFSRLVTHLDASTNNLAITALEYFFSSVLEYGVPGRIRVDGGSEFNHIEKFMNDLDGSKRCIRGKSSVHNQRIECLWRDVFTKVLSKYHGIFNHMENHRILGIHNNIHLFALHFVFEPRINRDLSSWRKAHNNHRLSTEQSQTPRQLWYENMIDCSRMYAIPQQGISSQVMMLLVGNKSNIFAQSTI